MDVPLENAKSPAILMTAMRFEQDSVLLSLRTVVALILAFVAVVLTPFTTLRATNGLRLGWDEWDTWKPADFILIFLDPKQFLQKILDQTCERFFVQKI